LALVATIILALAAGIGAGYAVIMAILYIFHPNRPTKTVTPKLIPSHNASGD